jgi:hypothetical protein
MAVPVRCPYSINKQPTLFLWQYGGMQIFVKPLTGKTITLDVKTVKSSNAIDNVMKCPTAGVNTPSCSPSSQEFVKTLSGKTITLDTRRHHRQDSGEHPPDQRQPISTVE